MSQVEVRAALETAVAVASVGIPTAYENQRFVPPSGGTPWQKCFVMFAKPQNLEAGRKSYNEVGYLQVTLMYPQGAGTGDSTAQAEALRSAFKRGNSFTSGGVVVSVTDTPEIGRQVPDGPDWAQVVRVPFMAQIQLP